MAMIDACNTIDYKSSAEDFKSLMPAYIKDSIYFSANNPFCSAKAKLGRYFFYDRRMSVNMSKACASCHAPAFSFTDSYRRSIGALGDNVQHNAPGLLREQWTDADEAVARAGRGAVGSPTVPVPQSMPDSAAGSGVADSVALSAQVRSTSNSHAAG